MSGMATMGGSSRAALAAARERLEAVSETVEPEVLSSELFGVVNVIDSSASLRRTLTDTARDASARARLFSGLMGDRVGEATLDVGTTAVRQTWARPRDLTDALEHLGVLAEVIGAQRAGTLDDLEDELFRFGRLVASNSELRETAIDQTVSAERRRDLVVGLLEGRASAVTTRLVSQAITAPRGLRLNDALEVYAKVAADWRDRLIATVRSAVPLTDGERERLARTLARQYGHEVRLNLIVDPEVIGGVRIDVGDDVVEGTVAGRLEAARRQIAS